MSVVKNFFISSLVADIIKLMLKLQNINDAMKMSPKTLLILTYLECINSQVAAMKALQLSVVQCHV